MGTQWLSVSVLPLLAGAMLLSSCTPSPPGYEFWFENRTSETLTVYQVVPPPNSRENTSQERLLMDLPAGTRRATGRPIYMKTESQPFEVAFLVRDAAGQVRYRETLRQPTVDAPAYLVIISEAGLAFVTADEPFAQGTPVVRKPGAPPTLAMPGRERLPESRK